MREVAAELRHCSEARLVKLGGAAAFAAGLVPLERMLLDLRPHADPCNALLTHLPWAGVLLESGADCPDARLAVLVPPGSDLIVGDVVDVQPARHRITVRYRRGDQGNVLFATERCNNYCLMCSQPPREIDDGWRVQSMLELADLIDPDEPSLGITGGEPTLLGQGLLDVVHHCARVLPRTSLHVLSNGRRFAESGFAARFAGTHPRLSWGIPLYGDGYRLHDYVVQAQGAFSDTMRGLYALQEARQRIEIRIVLVKPTVERLPQLARFIQRNLPFVEHVALMGIEPIGFAKAHAELLWTDPADAAPQLAGAVEILAGHGVPVSLYNLPLCVLPSTLRRYARRSISTWKQSYLRDCETCVAKTGCSGVFQWVTPKWTSRAIVPLKSEEEAHA